MSLAVKPGTCSVKTTVKLIKHEFAGSARPTAWFIVTLGRTVSGGGEGSPFNGVKCTQSYTEVEFTAGGPPPQFGLPDQALIMMFIPSASETKYAFVSL